MTDRLLAALMFFTRLPFWRIKTVNPDNFKYIVNYWPFVGWITGGAMALAFWWLSAYVPALTAALLAVALRLLLTGALHEDGLADFYDGFGGGTTRDKILSIMKDSHIGTYGVLGLIVHIGLLVSLTSSIPYASVVMLTADVYAKACGSFITLQLPYARTAEQAKSGVVYATENRHAVLLQLLRCLAAIAPCLAALRLLPVPFPYLAFVFPIVTELSLIHLMKKRLQGYTGDCCGALFLCCELSFYLAYVIFYTFI